jgi:hypothetical protein
LIGGSAKVSAEANFVGVGGSGFIRDGSGGKGLLFISGFSA